MGYYDGNTVTALWTMRKQLWPDERQTPSAPPSDLPRWARSNLVSGQTNGVDDSISPGSAVVADGNGGVTDVGDADPVGDVCSSTTSAIHMTGQNIGDLLNSAV